MKFKKFVGSLIATSVAVASMMSLTVCAASTSSNFKVGSYTCVCAQITRDTTTGKYAYGWTTRINNDPYVSLTYVTLAGKYTASNSISADNTKRYGNASVSVTCPNGYSFIIANSGHYAERSDTSSVGYKNLSI